jgi:hypothetical protein
MGDGAERSSGSEVLEPMWRATLGVLESTLALGEVALRVRTQTVLAESTVRALGRV